MEIGRHVDGDEAAVFGAAFRFGDSAISRMSVIEEDSSSEDIAEVTRLTSEAFQTSKIQLQVMEDWEIERRRAAEARDTLERTLALARDLPSQSEGDPLWEVIGEISRWLEDEADENVASQVYEHYLQRLQVNMKTYRSPRDEL